MDRDDVTGVREVPPTAGVGSCSSIREIASAAVDGEVTVAEQRACDEHVERCADCRRHVERLAVLTRQVRLRAAEPVPDLASRVLDRARPPRLGRGGWVRPALAWVAIVLAVQSVGPLILGDVAGASTHVARHVGAFSAALAVGLLYAVWRPHRAFGLLPFAAALTATMLVAGVLDVVSGESSLLAESIHLTELAGLVLLWILSGSPGLDRVLRRAGPRRRWGVPAS